MKTLLALINCHSRLAYANAQRETWIPRVPQGLDYRFFLGSSERVPKPDEVFLNCRDDYGGLPNKVQEVIRWALANGYDHMAKIDDDVVLRPSSFLSSGYQNHDFAGHINTDGTTTKIPWGFCYTLSHKAMEIMADAALPNDCNDESWCANTLVKHGILLYNEPRYILHRGKRSDFIQNEKRSIRAPKRPTPFDEGITPSGGIAYCVFVHWLGYHATPDELNIKEYHKLYKEVGQ